MAPVTGLSPLRAFVDVLAERAASWLVDQLDTVVLPSTNTSNGQLIVYLDIGDPQRNQGVRPPRSVVRDSS